MTGLEAYSKAEIINAIQIKARFDSQLIPGLTFVIKRERQDRAFAEWEVAQAESIEALNAFADFQRELMEMYGGFKVSEFTSNETAHFLKLAKESEDAEKREKAAYEKLKSVEKVMGYDS